MATRKKKQTKAVTLKKGKTPTSPIPISDSASFKAIATELIAEGVLDPDRPAQFVALSRYVTLLNHWLKLNELLLGDDPKNPKADYTQVKFDKDGNPSLVARPEVNMMLALGRQLESLEKSIGLTPESRVKLSKLNEESGDGDEEDDDLEVYG